MMSVTEPTYPQQVTRWRTSDGEEFPSIDSAIYHQERIGRAIVATKALRNGASVAEAFRVSGLRDSCPIILERVTADTKLIVSHWQCIDKPAYSPNRFRFNGDIYVHGDGGAWTGPYGDWVSIDALVRYAAKTEDYNQQERSMDAPLMVSGQEYGQD